MKKLFYFVFIGVLFVACSKNQEGIQPIEEPETIEQRTQLLVNVSVNEEERNEGCSGTCNTKAPIAGAIVSIVATTNTADSDEKTSYQATTTAGGYAIFKDIPGQIYNVSITCEYGDHNAKVNVEEKKRITLDVGF
jgi:hypothetical protein